MTKQITLRDIYDVVNRLEDKMDERIKPLENRVDILENGQTKVITILSGVSVFFTAVFTFLWNKFIKNL